jgi:RHS repeat-associated protein
LIFVRTETENGTVVENAYNGDGRRVIKTVNGSSTYYLYEYDKVILETNVYGDVTGRNVYGLNLLIRTVGIDTFYYMYNGHADVTALLTPSGDVAASYYYDAFGNILEQTGDVSNSILFAGYQYDKETGLYYLNARMYDPVTARFMQEDTFAGQPMDPLSLNLYTYCHNSPLMYWDPTGHWEESITVNGKTFDTSWLLVVDGKPVIRNAADAAFINHLNAELSRARKDLNLSIAKLPKEKQTEFNNRLESSPDIFKDIDSITGEVRKLVTYYYIVQKSKELKKVNSTNELEADPQVEEDDPVKQIDNNVQLLLDVIEATPNMTPELQAFYQELPNWFGVFYGHDDPRNPEEAINWDCGGIAMGIFYYAFGIKISKSGSSGNQDRGTNMMMTSTAATRDRATKSDKEVISKWETGASVGTIIQSCPVDLARNTKDELKKELLRPGDILFYDWSGGTAHHGTKGYPEGTTDHVAIYIGEDANGRGVIFEICSDDNPPHFDYLDEAGEHVNYDTMVPGWGFDNIVQVRRYLDG